MFYYRITKYNPAYRNAQGHYLKNEWTSYADVGKKFDGGVLTQEDYIKIENAYIEAIIAFMECLHLDNICIAGLDEPIALDNTMVLTNGIALNKEQIKAISRLILQEEFWCKFETSTMYVHFGYDFYLYIGTAKECKDVIGKIEKLGLFVEIYKSPYLYNIF